VAACFSAEPDGTPVLPFNPRTGAILPEVWQRWMDWDPVRMADKYADALRSLHWIWIDGGTRDEYFLELGGGAVRPELLRLGVDEAKIHFELIEGAGHGGIDYRYPLSLAWLAQRLAR